MVVASTSVAQFFDRLVLISNSVPKSGSTYLHSMQQNFLLSLCGKSGPNVSAFAEAGIEVHGSYIPKPQSAEFLALIASPTLTGGPFIVKTHTMLTADLRATLLRSGTIFASLSIRDPLDIYFSARDNFRKSGEFPEFGNVESGCETVNGFFTRIYESSVNTSHKKTVPIVRYEQIVSDPVGALLASLHPTIKDHVMRKIAEDHLNLQKAAAGASKRLNLGSLDRRAVDRSDADFDQVSHALAETRHVFGYAAKGPLI